MAQLYNLAGCSAFAEHLFDGVAGNDVNHQEDKREDKPKRGQSEQQSLQKMTRH